MIRVLETRLSTLNRQADWFSFFLNKMTSMMET